MKFESTSQASNMVVVSLKSPTTGLDHVHEHEDNDPNLDDEDYHNMDTQISYKKATDEKIRISKRSQEQLQKLRQNYSKPMKKHNSKSKQ